MSTVDTTEPLLTARTRGAIDRACKAIRADGGAAMTGALARAEDAAAIVVRRPLDAAKAMMVAAYYMATFADAAFLCRRAAALCIEMWQVSRTIDDLRSDVVSALREVRSVYAVFGATQEVQRLDTWLANIQDEPTMRIALDGVTARTHPANEPERAARDACRSAAAALLRWRAATMEEGLTQTATTLRAVAEQEKKPAP